MDILLEPLESLDLVQEAVVPWEGRSSVAEETKDAEAVAKGHEENLLLQESVGVGGGGGAGQKVRGMDVDEDGEEPKGLSWVVVVWGGVLCRRPIGCNFKEKMDSLWTYSMF
jgi:hypothetical protein